MRRRDFIGLLGGAATAASSAWPLAARARKNSARRLFLESGSVTRTWASRACARGFRNADTSSARNLLLEERYAEGDPARTRALIAELLALGVDVLVTGDFALILRAYADRQRFRLSALPADFVGVGLAAKLCPAGRQRHGPSRCCRPTSARNGSSSCRRAVPNLNRVAFLGDFSGLTAEEKRGLDEAAPRFRRHA